MRELDRVIIPEILDSLNPADPRAIRSRRDLSWIDLFLCNSRWIVRQLKKQTPPLARIIEIGAGEGALCRKVQTSLPSATVTGLDLIPRPANFPSGIQWLSGDFFQTLPKIDADACVGSLILHHFSGEALRDLGARLQSFRSLTFCEPLRSRLPLFLSKLSSQFMSEVTRHDMPASIRAGFRPGELSTFLGLDSKKWNTSESSHWRGALRLVASRR
ncbi:MAG: hypothetical protein CAK90_00225 [Spartobacteria bacterium AMD-G4]|nr:MAG: hypothetical protein CAK90_00225 [Spartobacteria bacterium AMD-G4]